MVNSSGYDEILTPPPLPYFPSPEIQTKSSGVHPSPARTGNIVTDQSHRVSHGVMVLSAECPGYIRFKTFQTHANANADVDMNHERPPLPIYKPRGVGGKMNPLIADEKNPTFFVLLIRPSAAIRHRRVAFVDFTTDKVALWLQSCRHQARTCRV